MRVMLPIAVVFALVVVGFVGWRVPALNYFFGVIVPYAAVATFIIGLVYRLFYWAKSPVPFRIPTTAGQEKSFPWIKQNSIDNPSTKLGVVIRMALEVLAFRSLFRNTAARVQEGPRLTYQSSKWLWGAGLVFHWSFLIIFIRHFRLFVDPVPVFVHQIEALDGFMQLTLPTFFVTDLLIVAAASYLFVRRVFLPQVKYLSLANDYFPLFLILGIALSGILLRYVTKADVAGVKSMIQGLVHLKPVVARDVHFMFYIHLFLVSTLLFYFPFSKLVHMPGVFLSPTRNLPNDSRMKRHINPWNPDVKFHTYAEYEEEFWKVMQAVDLPLDKEYEEEQKEKE